MRYVLVLAALAAALLTAPTASAGGWATVGLAPLPDGVGPGATWSPRITILQHGRTPLDGLSPTLTISDEAGGTHTFVAAATEDPGVYAADVTFPAAGRWSVVVDSGFGDSRLTFGPVTIGAAAGGEDGWPSVPAGGIAAVLALLLLGGAAAALRRARRLTPASR